MDQSSGNSSNSEAHFTGGDWSPRISFSHNFACIQRVPSPTKKSPLHDSEFEFSRSVGTDLLSAEELFCNGKLRPLKLSSHESGKREWKASQRKQEVYIMESSIKKGAQAACDGNAPSRKGDPSSVCKEDPISRWEQNGDGPRKTRSNAGEAKSLMSREEPISVCRRAEKVQIGMKPLALTPSTSRKEYLSSVNRTAEKLEDGKATLTLPRSREGLVCACKLEVGAKAGKSGSPTSRKELIAVCKPEMGENAGKTRSPSGREEIIIPACKLEISSKAGKLESRTCRDDAMSVCKAVKNLELEKKAGEVSVPPSREDLLSTRSTPRKSEKGSTTVAWREEMLWAKTNEEDEHAHLHSRRFSKHPRSASMIIEGSWRLGNRSCISLNNSRCPSPSRSFSLPSTTPVSPSASSSYAGVASFSVSSSSKYRSKIKDFFKLRKLTVAREETMPPHQSSSSSTCRVPLSPRSLFAFFKSKENSKAGSKSSSFMHEGIQQAHEHVCASNRDLYSGAIQDNSAKSKVLNALAQSQINKEPSISSLTLPNTAKPPPNPSFPYHFPLSSTHKAAVSTLPIEKTGQFSAELCAAGSNSRPHKSHEKVPAMLVIDEGLWEEGNFNRSNSAVNLHNNTNGPSKQGNQRVKKAERGNMMMMGGTKGGGL